MMNKCKIFPIFLCIIILLSACQSVKDGVVGTKRTKSGDEFLVHKKKPLVVPPDFEKLPSPKPLEKKTSSLSSSNKSVEDLLDIKNQQEDGDFENKDNSSLERSILKKINKN